MPIKKTKSQITNLKSQKNYQNSRIKNSDYSYSGFTLIELMVAMTIVAVLATIGIVIYSSTQKSGRMSKRIGDMKAVSIALEAYKSSNTNYPSTNGNWRGLCNSYNGGGAYNETNYIPGLVPNYMNILPTDPSTDASQDRCYLYLSNGIGYKFLIYNINEITSTDISNQLNYKDPLVDPTSTSGCGVQNSSRKFAVWNGSTSRCW